jgi:hypothetical protein
MTLYIAKKLTYTYRIIQSGKLLLVLAIIVILCADSRGTHDHISLSHDSWIHKTILCHIPENKYSSYLRLRELQFQHRWAIQKLGADDIVPCFNVLSSHSIEKTKENREKNVRIIGVPPETQTEDFRIQGRNVSAWANFLCHQFRELNPVYSENRL